VRLIPILNQLREGLRLYGLDEVLAQHTQMCQQLFVPGHLQEVSNIVNELLEQALLDTDDLLLWHILNFYFKAAFKCVFKELNASGQNIN